MEMRREVTDAREKGEGEEAESKNRKPLDTENAARENRAKLTPPASNYTN